MQLNEVLTGHFFGFVGKLFATDDREAVIAKSLENFDAIVNVLGNNDFLCGNNLTVCDFILFEMIETMKVLHQDERIINDNPTLGPFCERMLNLPKFGDYYRSSECHKAPFFIPAVKIPM